MSYCFPLLLACHGGKLPHSRLREKTTENTYSVAVIVLTKDFKELVANRMAQDPAFATALLREAIDTPDHASAWPAKYGCSFRKS
jgi:hypothetical protein